jgi:hypothetical protein
MSTDTDQALRRYVVRLCIQTIGSSPADAVQEALDLVLRGGLESLSYSVDEVADGSEPFTAATIARDSGGVADRTHGDAAPSHPDDQWFHGEFLG